MFTTGRVVFIIFFVLAFLAMMIFSYRKDAKNHKAYYKNAAKKVAIYGFLVVVAFVVFRLLTSML